MEMDSAWLKLAGTAAAAVLTAGIWMSLPGAASASDGDMPDRLAYITEANRIDALLEKYGAVSAEYRYYYSNKTIRKREIYRDGDWYIDEMGKDLWTDEKGEVYGFDAKQKKAWRALFTDGVYEDFRAAEVLHDWDLLADMAADGLVSWEETEPGAVFTEEVTEEYEHNDYLLEPGDRLRDEFDADPVTGEITQYRRYLLQEGEPEILLERGDFAYGGGRPQPEEELREQIFCDDSEKIRTVTLVTDAGTGNEKTYRQTVGKGCNVEIYLGLEYDDRIYADPECTKIYKAEKEDTEKDITVYTCTL